MRKLKVGDEVIVLTGRSKGKIGKILRLVKGDKSQKVVVEGANLVKKCKRGNPNKQETGGIVDIEAPLDVSNVAIYNPTTQKADRVGFKVVDGVKKRCFKSDNELIDIL